MSKKTIIHVNQHVIKKNKKNGENAPVVTCKTYNSNQYGHEVVLSKDGVEVARVVYRKNKPLSCGAHVWIETKCDVEVICHEDSEGESCDAKQCQKSTSHSSIK